MYLCKNLQAPPQQKTLNDNLTVKLQSPGIKGFASDPAIQYWTGSGQSQRWPMLKDASTQERSTGLNYEAIQNDLMKNEKRDSNSCSGGDSRSDCSLGENISKILLDCRFEEVDVKLDSNQYSFELLRICVKFADFQLMQS